MRLLLPVLASAAFAVETINPAAAPAESTPVTATAPASALDLRQKASYLIGVNMSQAVVEYNLDAALVAQAILDAAAKKEPLVPKAEAQAVLGAYQQELQGSKDKQAAGRKESNAAWLADNLKKEGVKATASGLQYKVLVAAKDDAAKPVAASQVKVHYKGSLTDGTVFDASANHGGPATFGVGQVIKGWTEALQLMGVGAKWELYIPSELAYGEQAPPSIGPNQILVFEVELLEILK